VYKFRLNFSRCANHDVAPLRYLRFTLSLLSAILPSEMLLMPNGRIAKENNRTLNIVVTVNA